MTCIALFLLLTFGVCSAVEAQAYALGGNEPLAGVVLNVALRTPVVARGWRQPLPRFVVAQGISVGYEVMVDLNRTKSWHAPLADIGMRAVGYLATEAVLALGRRVIR